MRIINDDTVSPSCFTTMDVKDVNGGPIPETDLKYSPTNNDTTSSNGVLSPPNTPSTATPSENEYNPTPSNSGRLKFYKDGKFILELLHHKNGERMFWIPVLKSSTCWPPVGQCTPRQESSTSLSVSDDNLSVQSSPWQRDHCWKQTVPRKNINRELEFTMHILRPRRMRFSLAAIRRRRRRPYEAFSKNEVVVAAKGLVHAKAQLPARMEVESRRPEAAHLSHGGRVRMRRRLCDVLQKLSEQRRPPECAVAVSSCRTDPGIVSPRKRILKEMEKVSLEEMGNANKKHRSQSVGGSAIAPCTTVTVVAAAATATSVCGLPTAATTRTKSTNSHSISSILSRDEEQLSFLRNLLKPPGDACPAGASAEASSSASSSPAAAADGMAHCSTPVAPSLASPLQLVSSACASSGLAYPIASKGLPPPLRPPLHGPLPPPMYVTPAFLYHSNSQPFLASPPISNHPPYYPAFAAGFGDAGPVWPVPHLSSPGRPSVYPSSSLLSSYPALNLSPWVPVVPSSLQGYPVAENGTDAPLNLSKH